MKDWWTIGGKLAKPPLQRYIESLCEKGSHLQSAATAALNFHKPHYPLILHFKGLKQRFFLCERGAPVAVGFGLLNFQDHHTYEPL